MPSYRTSKQMIIQTPDSYLGHGGEGDIYAVNNDANSVAKIYNKDVPSGGRQTRHWRRKEQKLVAMIENAPPTRDADGNVALAWPEDILYYHGGPNDRLMAGFTMPKIDTGQYKDIVNYYNPSLRAKLQEEFARKKLVLPTEGRDLEELLEIIIGNILTVLGNIHKLRYVIGDVNELNILVDYLGRVAFVDSDSFQVRDDRNGIVHRSQVGREDFLSPRVIELMDEKCTDGRCPSGRPPGHNKSFSCFDRGPEDDSFAIAVILFKLLMQGNHPFDGPDGSMKEKIRDQKFPYNRRLLTPPQRTKSRWNELSTKWQNYFRHTFVIGATYTAEEIMALGPCLAIKTQPTLGQQKTVSYKTVAVNNVNPSNASPAAPQPQNPVGPRNRPPQPQNPVRPRNRPPQAAPNLIRCPKCGSNNPAAEIFCQKPGCQAVLSGQSRACPRCKAVITVAAIFCPRCGRDQTKERKGRSFIRRW